MQPNKLQTSCGSQCLCCLKLRWVKERSCSDLGGERTVFSVWTLSSAWHLPLVLYQTAESLLSLCPSHFRAPEAGRWRLQRANEEALTSHATFTHLKKSKGTTIGLRHWQCTLLSVTDSAAQHAAPARKWMTVPVLLCDILEDED